MRNEIWLVVASLFIASAVVQIGCKAPSSEPEPGAVKGKNLTYEGDGGAFSIVYPSKWGDAPEKTENGRVLTSEPRLEVGTLTGDAPEEIVAEVIGKATPVGSLKTSEGVTTGKFEGESDGVPVTWYVRMVARGDGYVYAAVRDDTEGFAKSEAGYLKVVDGLTVDEPAGATVDASGGAVTIPDEKKAEAAKLAQYLLDQKGTGLKLDAGDLDDARRDELSAAATTFSVAQLCGWAWEDAVASWKDAALADPNEESRTRALAYFGASNQVILTHLKDEAVTCDAALEAVYRPRFDALAGE